jgi:hypothetical protein
MEKSKSKTKDSGKGGASSHPKALTAYKLGTRKYGKNVIKPKKAIYGVSNEPMQQVSPKFAKVKVKVVKAKNEDNKKKTIKRKRSKLGKIQKPTNNQVASRTWKPFMM